MITYRNLSSMRPYKEFGIMWGGGTVYREKIDLDIRPDQSLIWMIGEEYHVYRDLSLIVPGKPYEIGRNDVDMETELECSMEETKRKILPDLNGAVTLEKCYWNLDTYLYDEENFDGNFREHNEGLINYILYDPEIMKKSVESVSRIRRGKRTRRW